MPTNEHLFSLISAALAAYPETRVSENTILVYLAALGDIPHADLARALAEHIAHSEKFPTIAELRRLALAGRYPSEAEAWAEVKRGFAQFGRSGEPQFSNPLIGQAVESIGWRALCDSTQDNEPIDRAHFMRAYRSLVDRETFDRTSFSNVLLSLPAAEGE